MTIIELKNFLIYRIAGINDKNFLNEIQTIVESKTESAVYQTTPEQKERINEGRKQISIRNTLLMNKLNWR
jgi:hypothetical protein